MRLLFFINMQDCTINSGPSLAYCFWVMRRWILNRSIFHFHDYLRKGSISYFFWNASPFDCCLLCLVAQKCHLEPWGYYVYLAEDALGAYGLRTQIQPTLVAGATWRWMHWSESYERWGKMNRLRSRLSKDVQCYIELYICHIFVYRKLNRWLQIMVSNIVFHPTWKRF